MCVYNEYIVYSLFVEIKQQLKSRINLIFLIRVFTNFMYINIYTVYNMSFYYCELLFINSIPGKYNNKHYYIVKYRIST